MKKFLPYPALLAHNEAVSEQRRRRREKAAARRDFTVDRSVDLMMDLERLSDMGRTICTMLMEGHNISAIASRLGCGRQTVRRKIVSIRTILADYRIV